MDVLSKCRETLILGCLKPRICKTDGSLPWILYNRVPLYKPRFLVFAEENKFKKKIFSV